MSQYYKHAWHLQNEVHSSAFIPLELHLNYVSAYCNFHMADSAHLVLRLLLVGKMGSFTSIDFTFS